MQLGLSSGIGLKLKIAYLLFLLPIAFLFYQLVSTAIASNRVTHSELAGVDYVSALLDVEIRLASGHAGPKDVADTLAMQEERRGVTLGTIAIATAHSDIAGARTAADARHVVADLIGTVADKSLLSLDSDLDTYYLQNILAVQIPRLTDRLSTLAETVSTVSDKGALGPNEQAEMLSRIGSIDEIVPRLRRSIAIASGTDIGDAERRTLEGLGDATTNAALKAASDFQALVSQDNIDRRNGGQRLVAPAITSLADFTTWMSAELAARLQARIERTRRILLLNIGAALLLFLTAVGFVVFGLEIGAVRPLKRLTYALHELSRGATAVPIVATDRSDEIGDLARAAQDFRDSLLRTRALEAELRNANANLLLAQRMGKIGSSVADVRTLTSVWSDEMFRIFGLAPRPHMPLEEFLASIHPDDRRWMRDYATRAYRGETVSSSDFRIVRADGEIRWVHSEHEIVRDVDGGPQTIFVTRQDVTERKRLEDELRQSHDRMAEILAALEVARSSVMITDHGGHMVYANAFAIQVRGLPPREQILGRRLREFQSQGSDYLAAADRALNTLANAGSWEGIVPWQRPIDGRLIYLDAQMQQLPNGGFVALATDATERIRLEEEDRRHREREAQSAKVEALGNLAGGIAHDFNNLLGAILGFAEFLVEDLKEQPEQRHFASRIVSVGQRGRSLVRQILAFSRRTKLQETMTPLRDPIEETCNMLRAMLPSTMEIRAENALEDANVLADKGQLVQVLVNLCVNANDALDGEPGTVTISVSRPDRERTDLKRLPPVDGRPSPPAFVSWIDEDGTGHLITGGLPRTDCVSLAVTDTGSGIPHAMLGTILQPFVTTKAEGKGTGLGLAVVHRIITEYGGAMTVTTREGTGSRFEIILPLSVTAEETADMPTDSAIAVKARDASVLVVDDDEAYLAMVETALRRLGYQVRAVNDSRTALEAVAQQTWDVLVCDQTMPHLRGTDLIRSCKTARPYIVCIICTGFSSGLNEEQATAAGADALMLKPYNVRELGAVIARLTGARAGARVNL